MDQHITFTKAACGFCSLDISTENGICPIPTCGLTVHFHALIGGPGYPVIISPECGQTHAGELVVSIVKAAAHEVAERRLEACLAERNAEEIAADEMAQIEYGVREEMYELRVFSDSSVHTTPEVAEEVAKLLASLKIEHFFDQEIRELTK